MRPQVGLLQKQFKTTASSTTTAAVINVNKFLLPRSMGTGTINKNSNNAKSEYFGMAWLQQRQLANNALTHFEQFHSTATMLKDDESKGNSGDNFVMLDEDSIEGMFASGLPPKSVRGQGLPKCTKCGRPLRNMRNTVNGLFILWVGL